MSKHVDDRRYSLKRWRDLREEALRRDGYRCAIPGCPQPDLRPKGAGFADHIIEVRDGGPFWSLRNLQSLCKPHHDAKTLAIKADRTAPRSPNA